MYSCVTETKTPSKAALSYTASGCGQLLQCLSTLLVRKSFRLGQLLRNTLILSFKAVAGLFFPRHFPGCLYTAGGWLPPAP